MKNATALSDPIYALPAHKPFQHAASATHWRRHPRPVFSVYPARRCRGYEQQLRAALRQAELAAWLASGGDYLRTGRAASATPGS
jgi:hypothetical protein